MDTLYTAMKLACFSILLRHLLQRYNLKRNNNLLSLDRWLLKSATTTKTAACKFCPINWIKKHQTRTIHSIITCRIGLQQMFCLLLDFLVTTSPRLLSKYRNFKFNGSWRSINISAKRGYKRNNLSCWKWSWGNFEKFKFFPKITS